jgi:hypothetical protein
MVANVFLDQQREHPHLNFISRGILKAKSFTTWIFSNLGKINRGEKRTQTLRNKRSTTGEEIHNSLTNQRKVISHAETTTKYRLALPPSNILASYIVAIASPHRFS